MQEILGRHLPDHEKIESYNEALQKSRLFTRKSVPDPLLIKVVKNTKRVEENKVLKKLPTKIATRQV